MRVRADIWTAAVIRRAQGAGAYATIVRKGQAEGGVVFVKVNRLDGTAWVLAPVTGGDGERRWLRAGAQSGLSDAEADAYVARAAARDPDCWILEIEDRQGRWFFDEPVD
jgi:hypothetical protein